MPAGNTRFKKLPVQYVIQGPLPAFNFCVNRQGIARKQQLFIPPNLSIYTEIYIHRENILKK